MQILFDIWGFFVSIWDSFYSSVIYDNRYKYILEGLFNTITIAFFAVIIGVVIGIAIALIRNYYDKTNKLKLLNSISKLYVNIIRGTPVILQLMIIYYVIFKSVDINIVLVVTISLFINMIVGAMIGGFMPILFKKIDVDPSIISAPVIATVLDITGIIIYLIVTTIILSKIV